MKKGYIFSVDAVIAALIAIGGVFLLVTAFPEQPDLTTPRHLSSDLMSLLFDVKIKDLCEGPPVHIPECRCVYESLQDGHYCANKVLDPEMTLLEYFGYLYKLTPANTPDINDIINETIQESGLVPMNYDFTFLLTDLDKGLSNITTIYPVRT